MRIRRDIDARSALLVAAQCQLSEQGGASSTNWIDESLDERGTATDG
jgi:hypothetical protein